ncbi:hypothetical protein PFISCL1PPCAC_2148, partial [Pristionchus fissidentatus]
LIDLPSVGNGGRNRLRVTNSHSRSAESGTSSSLHMSSSTVRGVTTTTRLLGWSEMDCLSRQLISHFITVIAVVGSDVLEGDSRSEFLCGSSQIGVEFRESSVVSVYHRIDYSHVVSANHDRMIPVSTPLVNLLECSLDCDDLGHSRVVTRTSESLARIEWMVVSKVEADSGSDSFSVHFRARCISVHDYGGRGRRGRDGDGRNLNLRNRHRHETLVERMVVHFTHKLW